jgi:hypothetical protein
MKPNRVTIDPEVFATVTTAFAEDVNRRVSRKLGARAVGIHRIRRALYEGYINNTRRELAEDGTLSGLPQWDLDEHHTESVELYKRIEANPRMKDLEDDVLKGDKILGDAHVEARQAAMQEVDPILGDYTISHVWMGRVAMTHDVFPNIDVVLQATIDGNGEVDLVKDYIPKDTTDRAPWEYVRPTAIPAPDEFITENDEQALLQAVERLQARYLS